MQKSPTAAGSATSTPEEKKAERDTKWEVFTAYRSYVQHQYEITNHRTMWFATMQAFLFTTFGFTVQSKLNVLGSAVFSGKTEGLSIESASLRLGFVRNIDIFLIFLCLIGGFIAVIVYYLLDSAREPIAALAEKWETIIFDGKQPNDLTTDLKNSLKEADFHFPLLVGGHSQKAATWGRALTLSFPGLIGISWFMLARFVVLDKQTINIIWPNKTLSKAHWFPLGHGVLLVLVEFTPIITWAVISVLWYSKFIFGIKTLICIYKKCRKYIKKT